MGCLFLKLFECDISGYVNNPHDRKSLRLMIWVAIYEVKYGYKKFIGEDTANALIKCFEEGLRIKRKLLDLFIKGLGPELACGVFKRKIRAMGYKEKPINETA